MERTRKNAEEEEIVEEQTPQGEEALEEQTSQEKKDKG